MNKKILIVTEYFYPNETTTSYYLTQIIKEYSKYNEVKVITNTELKQKHEIINENIEVIRIQENKLNKNNLFSRVFKLIISSIKLSWIANKFIKTNTHLFTVTNPAFIMVFFAIIKKFKKFNYTLLVYDVFPENLLATNILKKKSIIYKLVKKLFDWSYSKADRLIVIGRDMEEVIQEKTNNQVPITIMENWCNYKEIIPCKKDENKIIKILKLEYKKVFLFAGNLGRVQGIDNLIEATRLVKDKDFRLLFIGDGAMKNRIEEYIKNNQNSKIIYGGAFPQSEQNNFLNACDVAIVSLDKSMYGLGVPSKSYYNMAAEKPILYIGDRYSEIARVVSDFDIGWVSPPDEPTILANDIDIICNTFDSIAEKGLCARKVIIENFSEDIILAKYRALYK